ncbi:4Fe-4S dicluster domain-containing protein [Bythopirellula polymerisocia]|nr:4Fe-4S dicluster domain-containing protein [Bythopirellula polymerisocia]
MNQNSDDHRSLGTEPRGLRRLSNGYFVSTEEAPALSRREFLEAAGFSLSLAAMSGCGRAPVESALPFPIQPVGAIPGRLQYYASTCAGCPAACGLLIGTRDGRPLKMEGLPEHPLSQGGLCAVGQALPIGLYDSQRLIGLLRAGKKAEWAQVDEEILQGLRQIKDQEQQVVIVTSTITSPTIQASIDSFLDQFQNAKHVVLDAVSSSAILDAHEQTHAVRVLPHYRFDRAEVVVSFGADFLGTWISPVEFTADWSARRVPREQSPEMSYHVQLESRMSLTGSNADRRIAIHPSNQGPLVARLADKLAAAAGRQLDEPLAPRIAESDENLVSELAERLWNARGKSLVLCDSQEVGVQTQINFINDLLGNYEHTLDIERPSLQRQGNDREVQQLVEDIRAKQVGALIVAEVDLLYDLAGHESLSAEVGEIPLTISFSHRVDEFAAIAKFVCPDHHTLESWSDAEPISGLISLIQPTIRPLSNTRAIVESLAVWSGQPQAAYEVVKDHWEKKIFPRRRSTGSSQFLDFWEQALRDGFVEVSSEAPTIGRFETSVLEPVAQERMSENFSLVLYNKVSMLDSRHSHNPWLQELPDPVTKVTWDNYVSISPRDAAELGIQDGDVVKVSAGKNGSRIELPALIQPGQHDGVLAVALAYGCKGTDRFAKIGPQWIEARPSVSENGLVGVNAAVFVSFHGGTQRYTRAGFSLAKTSRHRELAATQEYNSLELPPEVAPHGAERRKIVQHTTLAAFTKDAEAGAVEEHFSTETQLWPEDHPKPDHTWGMVIDLNKCTGCSACVIACQSENNIPVVGYDEVRRQREMHWIRIDRYYDGEDEDLNVAHQPMMCQHCGNAPCETVCPVLATVHSSEGLNEQVYNRCVGTRYCANNCPYKVRRFNWFKYPYDDTLQNLVLNPEVTVRSRGVMEKCSMCFQRIEAGKIEARSQGLPIVDGAIQTACQQSCPASAIVFGDMNDPQSEIHLALENPRRYRVLEELNVRPAVSYLRVVRNRDEESQHG